MAVKGLVSAASARVGGLAISVLLTTTVGARCSEISSRQRPLPMG